MAIFMCKTRNCPKRTASVISFKGCSKAEKWLGRMFRLMIRVNVTNPRPSKKLESLYRQYE